jgi:hypothetical protein
VPVVTQYATAGLIAAIAYEGRDPQNDPAWASTGASSQALYGRWCRHMCGMACLRMALLHRDGHAPSLFQLLTGARHHGAYVEREDESIAGLIYAPFVEYVQAAHRLPAAVHSHLDLHELARLLDEGSMVMASVSKEIRWPEHLPKRRGGHLVLAIGRDDHGHVVFRNPSGHTSQARAATMPLHQFGVFFASRGVSLDPRLSSSSSTPAEESAFRPVASPPTT